MAEERKSIKMKKGNIKYAFFELLKAGLWEKDAELQKYGEIDIAAIMCMSEE